MKDVKDEEMPPESDDVNELKKVIRGAKTQKWRAVIADEVHFHLKHRTSELVDRPEQGKAIESKLILKNKVNGKGKIERKKAQSGSGMFAKILLRLQLSGVTRDKIRDHKITCSLINGIGSQNSNRCQNGLPANG